MKKRKKMTFGRAMKWMICSLLVGSLIGGAFGFGYTVSKNGPSRDVPVDAPYTLADNGYTGNSSQKLLSNPLLSGKVMEVTNRVKDSVVVIIMQGQEEVQTIFGQSYVEEFAALGSGIIFREDEDKLYVLTNAHVIENATEAFLYFDEETQVNIYLVGESVSNDLAVVYVNKSDLPRDVREELKVAALGDSDQVRRGDLAIAIGCPYSQSMAHTTTAGIVTGVNQEFAIEDRVLTTIQTDASLNPGNSGGALFNENGEVIGVNSAGIRDGYVEGMGFAIAINTAKEVIEEIFGSGTVEKASIGIESATYIDEEASRLYRVPTGLFVYQLTPGGAAERAGIRQGDVIVSIEGIRIENENTLDEILAQMKGGETVTAEVVRGRNTDNVMTMNITLDSVSDANTHLPASPEGN